MRIDFNSFSNSSGLQKNNSTTNQKSQMQSYNQNVSFGKASDRFKDLGLALVLILGAIAPFLALFEMNPVTKENTAFKEQLVQKLDPKDYPKYKQRIDKIQGFLSNIRQNNAWGEVIDQAEEKFVGRSQPNVLNFEALFKKFFKIFKR